VLLLQKHIMQVLDHLVRISAQEKASILKRVRCVITEQSVGHVLV